MDSKNHWEEVYRSKAPDAVSWYRSHLETSLRLIAETTSDRKANIIDVGGGESTLVDDLLERGYRNLTVLDMSAVALDATKRRLGPAAEQITWVEADIKAADLPEHRYDVWHDRAMFHFLTEASQRDAYIRLLARALKPGGHVVIATFGPAGPVRCSALEVRRYEAQQLSDELCAGFKLVTSTSKTITRLPAIANSFFTVTSGNCDSRVKQARDVTRLLRQSGRAQQAPDCCTGEHRLVPYEQYTQQAPGFGLSTVLQCSHL